MFFLDHKIAHHQGVRKKVLETPLMGWKTPHMETPTPPPIAKPPSKIEDFTSRGWVGLHRKTV